MSEMINTISTIFLLCLLFSVLISLKLQKILLKPLSHLIKTTQEVRYKKDYSIRVKQVSDDEFFYLAVNFNHMLDEIDNQYKKQLLIEEEVRQLNLFLEDKVNARTIELKVANKYLMTTLEELEQSKHQLVEQEKMASLGALVAGIAHEINTPVGIGVTAVSHLDDMANELNVKVKSKKLSQKYLESFIEKTLAGTKMSLTNLSRAADLISSFKMIAVDQSSDNLRTFPFKQYLHEILLSLQPQFKGLNHKITISCDEKINIYGNAGAIAQIFTNLLMNTLLHGFENKNSGNINIEVNLSGDDIEFDYSDDGCGMSQALLMKLFDPFFTTKRDNGGSGLGAHLIYNLVTQALHGRIVATSVMGEGLHFKIVFPKKAP